MEMNQLLSTRTRLLACLVVGLVLCPLDVNAQRRLPMRRATATAGPTSPRSFTPAHEKQPAPSAAVTRAIRVINDDSVRRAQAETVLTVQDDVEQMEPIAEGEWIDAGVVVEEGGESCADCVSSQGWGSHAVQGFWADHLSIFGGAHGLSATPREEMITPVPLPPRQ